MAKIVLALVLSLLLVVVIRSEAQADPSAPVADQWGQAAASAKGAAESMAASATGAAEDAKDAASSWTDWFTGRLKGLGFTDSDGNNDGPAAAPKAA
ncbi:hypothetical protein ACJRO7_023498 [Eucalyptus globulus]|uniref:Uncharacterized protein n=1 Tax=Eucalyptus globulus TaxID=34317 RepID=A0ABD3K243_EUCGL